MVTPIGDGVKLGEYLAPRASMMAHSSADLGYALVTLIHVAVKRLEGRGRQVAGRRPRVHRASGA